MRLAFCIVVMSLLLGQPVQAEDDFDTSRLKRHKTMGLVTPMLVGFNFGLGMGLFADSNDPPNQSLRALHLMSSLSLVGLAIYQVWDGPKLAGKKDKMTSHGHWAYAYLGLLAATGIAGVLSGHFVERDSSGYQTAKRVHFGLAAGTTAAVTLTILHAPL